MIGDVWRGQLITRLGFPKPATGNKVLVTWWGAFDRPWATIGDYSAVQNVASRLVGDGIAVDVATVPAHSFAGVPGVDWRSVDPRQYRCVVFVCGPIVWRKRLRRHLARFWRSHKIAVGVSVLEDGQGTRAFDCIVARDGTADATFDLALADAAAKDPGSQEPGMHVALCFAGKQGEYGDACLYDKVESLLTAVGGADSSSPQAIDTVIGPHNAIADISNAFAKARLVLTTRLHGSLFALRYGVPFVAVDQIAGGGKLSAVLRRLDWPFVFEGSTVTSDQVVSAIEELKTQRGAEILAAARTRAIALSTEALTKSVAAVKGVLD